VNQQLLALNQRLMGRRVETIRIAVNGHLFQEFDAPKGGYAEITVDGTAGTCLVNIMPPPKGTPAAYAGGSSWQ
jgi:hypothetical protein